MVLCLVPLLSVLESGRGIDRLAEGIIPLLCDLAIGCWRGVGKPKLFVLGKTQRGVGMREDVRGNTTSEVGRHCGADQRA
jgi:hypothetical protein